MPRLSGLLLALALAGFLLPAGAGAQGSLGVKLVTPPDQPTLNYFHFTLKPGETGTGTVILENHAEQAHGVRVYAGDCYNSPNGALSGPLFGEPNRAAGTWMEVTASHLVLAAGDSQKVSFKIRVPDGTPPGDHFAFLFSEPEAAKAGVPAGGPEDAVVGVKLVTRVGVSVWVRVPGALSSGLKVAEVTKRLESGRLYLDVRIENTGNTYLKPSGAWTLRSSGGDVVASGPRQALGYLMAGHPLDLKLPIQTERPLARGQYSLEMTVEYENQKLTEAFPVPLP